MNSAEAFYASLASPRKGSRREPVVSKKQRGGRTLMSTKQQQKQIKELRGKVFLPLFYLFFIN